MRGGTDRAKAGGRMKPAQVLQWLRQCATIDMASKAQTKPDAVVLSMTAIVEHARANPKCVIPLEFPLNKGRGTYDPALEFAKSLLTEHGHYPNLARVFEDVRRRTAGRGTTSAAGPRHPARARRRPAR